jgi:hypothetical protein
VSCSSPSSSACCGNELTKFWQNAKVGAKILEQPRIYLGRVALPEAIGWGAKLGVIAAIGMLVRAFGWTGGKQLVRQSYAQAKAEAATRSSSGAS